MSQADTDRVHMQYIRQLVRVVMSDGGVTQQERDGLWLAADTLGISREVVEEILNNNPTIDDNMVVSTLTLQPGDRVAFTGTHAGEEAAKFAGLIVGDATGYGYGGGGGSRFDECEGEEGPAVSHSDYHKEPLQPACS